MRRIAMLSDYETRTGDLRPLAESALGHDAGHTLRRLADDLDAAFAGRPARVGIPGRFAADAAVMTARSC